MSSELGASDAVVSRQVPVTASGCHTYVFFWANTMSVSGVLTADGLVRAYQRDLWACPESYSKGVVRNPLAVVSLIGDDFTNVWGQVNLSPPGGRLDMPCSPAQVR